MSFEEFKPDVAIYEDALLDVICGGDVVCGEFSIPIHEGVVEQSMPSLH